MKTVVITGGTRGIGAGLVKNFLKEDFNVVFSGLSDESVAKAKSSLSESWPAERILGVVCDVRDMTHLNNLWEKARNAYGKVDIWVNNAGRANLQEDYYLIDADEIAGIVDTNITGLMLATHIAYNNMLIQGSGAIYNMEGLGSDGRTITGMTPYGTTKRAVRYFTDAFAKEAKKRAVIIGTISPGMVLTDLTIKPIKEKKGEYETLTKIYNILANEVDTVTPFLVREMINNRKNGAKISWLTTIRILGKFLASPFVKRDIVSKYLKSH
jgi:NADP-dependent 3-hydroxy acid dehydrogenase YdfG